MAAFARTLQVVHRAPDHHLAPVAQEGVEHLPDVQQPRLAIHQGDHVHAEAVLQLGLLVQVVEHHLGNLAALELDHRAHARFVGLVADFGDALEALLAHQFTDAHQQVGLVHLVGQLVDDDRLTLAAVDVLEMRSSADDYPATPGAVRVADARHTVEDASGREVWRRQVLHQPVDVDVRVLEQCQAGRDHLAQVVRRDVGRHAHGDAGRTVDQQVRHLGRQDQRLALGAVVVRPEIDGLLVDVGEQFVRDARHPDLGVAHRSRVVAIDRPEVALAVDQRVAQRERLCHAHDGVVHRGITVRVVLADHVADDAGGLLVSPVPVVRQLVHRIEHPSMDGLEPVAHVRQRSADDDTHRVVEVRPAHLFLETDRYCFLGELIHLWPVGERGCGQSRGFYHPGRARPVFHCSRAAPVRPTAALQTGTDFRRSTNTCCVDATNLPTIRQLSGVYVESQLSLALKDPQSAC